MWAKDTQRVLQSTIAFKGWGPDRGIADQITDRKLGGGQDHGSKLAAPLVRPPGTRLPILGRCLRVAFSAWTAQQGGLAERLPAQPHPAPMQQPQGGGAVAGPHTLLPPRQGGDAGRLPAQPNPAYTQQHAVAGPHAPLAPAHIAGVHAVSPLGGFRQRKRLRDGGLQPPMGVGGGSSTLGKGPDDEDMDGFTPAEIARMLVQQQGGTFDEALDAMHAAELGQQQHTGLACRRRHA